MLKFLTLNEMGITAICGIIAVLLTSCKTTMAVDVGGESQSNLLIGSGKNIQGRFVIGYAKLSHKPGDIDFEIAPALADEVNLRTRLSVTAESTKLDSDAIFGMPIFIITGMGKIRFSDAEQSNLKTYLTEKGGFLMVDAQDSDFQQSIRSELRKLFPDKPLQDITSVGQSKENWYEINGQRFAADVLKLDGRVAALIPKNMRQWDFRNLDINNPAAQFGVNVVTHAVTNSPIVERHEYTPVTLTAHKIEAGIEVKAGIISHKAKDLGVLTLTLVHPDGGLVAEQQKDLTVSNEKVLEYKTVFPKQDNPGKHRMKYSWKTNQYKYAGNVSLGELIGELDTRVLGQTQWYAGSPASLRVIALNHTTQSPIRAVKVNAQVVMKDKKSVVVNFSGKTDNRGTVEMRFNAPENLEGSAELQVKVDSPMGTDNVKQDISIVKTHKILLSTDKPLYQPGQTIHIRSLALNAATLKPIGDSQITLEVEDAKGNKVFKYIADTDKFGIAAADFNLADEINMGTYTIRAILGEVTQEKKVTIDRYVLPKFKLNFSTDKDFYSPAETVKGELQADYFFGKPVADGKVTIKASKFDVGFDEFAQVEGKTDKNGHYTFELKLPSHFVGQPLEQGNTFVMFDISVVDGAEHEEKITQNRSVVKSPITIVIIPESGDIVPNVENIIYVMTTYPDGKPAETTVEVEQASSLLKSRIQTDSLGVAVFRVKPQTNALSLKVTAVDKQGNRAERSQNFQAEAENTLLLRTDEALYKVGDVIHAEVFSAKQAGSVYIDLIKSKQTILTKSVEMKNGRGLVDIHLSENDFGTLELHAYQITSGSNIIRDTRIVYVDSADDLNIGITASKQVYLPGEEAKLDFSVTDPEGHPVLAALGIQVVDESVFALQEMQPGLEKVYFTLEKELLKPKYEIHGYTMDSIVIEPLEQRERRQTAAKVLLASIEQVRGEYSLNLRTYEQKEQQYKEELQTKVAACANTIAEAMRKYFEKTHRSIESQHPLQTLVDERFLKPKDIIDPWGAPFIITYEGLHSLGPDGLLNTDDDITVWHIAFANGLGWMVEKERRVDAEGFLRRGAGKGVRFKKAEVMNGKVQFLMAREAPEAAPMTVTSTALAEAKSDTIEAPRIRQYFPETLFVTPALLTDEKGKATLGIPMADSITTWRLTSMASSLNGQLGSTTAGIRVFQDFFIDIDLPVSLTQNDEVSIPIAIYNYLPSEQNIRLKLTQESWFELIEDGAERQITLQKDQVSVMYYRLKVKEIGWHKLTMHAYGDKMSDAISRQIEVIPDGKQFLISQSDRLESDVERKIEIPAAAIDGASKVLVKIYPGVFSQVMEGLENILQMPFGCFEQTSSTTYPNILALNYMKVTKQSTPEVQMKAEEYINLGYQRLLSFEVQGGGFSWFGDAPANQVLTAYGLMEFHDMAQVHEVDPKVIERTQNWLISRQQADGSWEPDKAYLHQESWGRIQNSKLLPTAYIIWALLESVKNTEANSPPFEKTGGISQQNINKGVGYIRAHLKEADDAYTLAIIANALVRADKNDASTNEVMEKLKNMAIEDKDTAHWESKISTITHSHGDSANIETTAMAAQALLKYGRYSALTNKVLTYLIRQKDSNGTWRGTQATILALKALLMSIGSMTEKVDATVKILINGAEAERLRITPENSDVMRLVDLEQQTIEGFNTVQLKLEGKGSLMYQIVGKFYLPWKAGEKPEIEPLSIDVVYDKRELEKDDMVTCKVTVVNNKPATANMVLVDLGIPPGFEVQTDGLTELVESGTIKKFNLTSRQIIIYFDKLISKQPVELKYRIRAKFPIKAKTRVSRVYEYYNPEVESFAEPVELVVTD
ncbi:DUF4159 domain-containing protein [Candidatus Poribacteria bacterium]|nr:DUF4159 domain-containing protein [Candidatus Poribacteria bacterium]